MISKNLTTAIGVILLSSGAAFAECKTIQECANEAVQAAMTARAQVELSVPPGAVMAFALEECPKPYWTEYEPAYGRFVRGIDRSGSGLDPDGERVPGENQGDAFASHSHPQVYKDVQGHFSRDGWEWVPHVNQSGSVGSNTAATGASETRPKNVALLYCIRK